jgi:hypothetical protein
MKNNKPIYLAILVIGIALLLFVFFFNSSGGGGTIHLYKKQATCDVTVTNPILSIGQLKVENDAYCTSKKVLVCNPFSAVRLLSVISTSGNLVFESEGIQNHIAVDVSGVPFFNSKKYTISVCGMSEETTTGTLKVVVGSQSSDIIGVTFP